MGVKRTFVRGRPRNGSGFMGILFPMQSGHNQYTVLHSPSLHGPCASLLPKPPKIVESHTPAAVNSSDTGILPERLTTTSLSHLICFSHEASIHQKGSKSSNPAITSDPTHLMGFPTSYAQEVPPSIFFISLNHI